jgi:hypothetical protein
MKQKFKYNSDMRNELGIKKGECFTLVDKHLACITETSHDSTIVLTKEIRYKYAYTVAFHTESIRGSVRVLPHNDWINLIALSVAEE